MKRLVTLFLMIAALGMILSGNIAAAQSGMTPHENPATAVEELDEFGILLAYSRIMDLVVETDYESARDFIQDLQSIEIPDTIKYIANRYNTSFGNLLDTLENVESQLGEASDLLTLNQTGDVRQILDSIENSIEEADLLLKEIGTATENIGDTYEGLTDVAMSQLEGASRELEKSTESFSTLVASIEDQRQELDEKYVEVMTLASPELTLSTTPKILFVGDNISVYGGLLYGDQPLSRKTVSFIFNDEPVASAVTGSDGVYDTVICLSDNYIKNATLAAHFEPAGDDTEKYIAASSPPVLLEMLFYPTTLEAALPDQLYLGIPVTISGHVSSPDNTNPRTLNIYLNETLLSTKTVYDDFNIDVTLTESERPGSQTLKAEVLPWGRYSGDSVEKEVTVFVPAVRAEVNVDPAVISPGSIDISGTVNHDFGPVADAEVNIKIGSKTFSAVTAEDGSFSRTIETAMLPGGTPAATNPFYVVADPTPSVVEFSPFANREIAITVQPTEPFYPSETVTTDVLMINPLTIGLILAVAGVLGVYVYRRRTAVATLGKIIPGEEAVVQESVSPISVFLPRLTGIRGRVLLAYRAGLTAVEKITGKIMSPGVTLREFLKLAPLPSAASADRFAELTAIAEGTLYSPHLPRKPAAERAEELAESIEEELHRESA